MRRLLILPMIALIACVGVTFRGGPQRPTTVSLKVGALDLVTFTIRKALTDVRDGIPARRAGLHPIPCGTETCYALDEVQDAIAKIRRDMKAAFPREALASCLTIDEEIAHAANHLAVVRRTSAIQLVRNAPDHSVPLVRAQEVDATFARAGKPIDTYLAHGDLKPTLHIHSEPAGAQFRMLIGTNEKTARRTATQNDLKSVWRGRYTGTMSKKGYREAADFEIDLFHSEDTTVRCTLASITAPDNDVSTCRLLKD
jgi:hypothetical protein